MSRSRSDVLYLDHILERIQRILVVRRDKNHSRHVLGSYVLHDFHTRKPRHLHIEEDQVRRHVFDHSSGFSSAGRLAYHRYIVLLGKQVKKPLACGSLVIDDQHL